MGRSYLGAVGKFYRNLCLIYPRHCVSNSIKIGQVLIVEVMTKKFWCSIDVQAVAVYSVVWACCSCIVLPQLCAVCFYIAVFKVSTRAVEINE